MCRTPTDREVLQVVGDEVSVEMPRVVHGPGAVQEARRELRVEERRLSVAGVLERLVPALLALVRPVVRERDLVDVREDAERVVEMVVDPFGARLAPVVEAHGALESGIAMPHPLVLRQSEEVEEDLLQIRDGGLSDADLRDRGRLEHRNLDARKRLLQVGSRHPAGGAASDHDHTLDQCAIAARTLFDVAHE
jgi:hypothetical protein